MIGRMLAKQKNYGATGKNASGFIVAPPLKTLARI